MKNVIIATFGILLMPGVAFCDTIFVPDDHPTIQAAVVAAVDGDEVVVRPGTFVECIDFLGKAITVRSRMGPGLTFIDGNYLGTVVTFASGESESSVLEGFTIIHGYADPFAPPVAGGGIKCISSSPTITGNMITDNGASSMFGSGMGGGIFCSLNSSPVIAGNTITRNAVGGQYGGVGGAICLVGYCSATITGNTISDNYTDGGGAIHLQDSSATITNMILWQERGALANVDLRGSSTLSVSYSDVEGGQSSVHVDSGCTLTWGAGMIDADPLFVDPANGDLRLQQDPCQTGVVNPCVDAGDPISPIVTGTTRTGGSKSEWEGPPGHTMRRPKTRIRVMVGQDLAFPFPSPVPYRHDETGFPLPPPLPPPPTPTPRR